MNELETFSIGLGNDAGETSVVILHEKKNRIEIANLKPSQIDHPQI